MKKQVNILDSKGRFILKDHFYLKEIERSVDPKHPLKELYYLSDVNNKLVALESPSFYGTDYRPIQSAQNFFSSARELSLTEAENFAKSIKGYLKWYRDTIWEFVKDSQTNTIEGRIL